MVFLVPYDGSAVADAALDSAVEHGQALEEDVVAISLIPTGAEYALRRKWIAPDDEFAVESARTELQRKIEETTDDAERNFTDSGASHPGDGVADRIRRVATDIDADVLFVGVTEANDDGLETPFGSISATAEYDVHIVRNYAGGD